MPAIRFAPFWAAWVVCVSPAAADEPKADEVDFTRDVRPILSRRCFKCHGPDDKARKAGLRLDDRAAAVRKKAIVPGKPADSTLVQRIVTKDDGEIMPPPGAKNALTEAEKAILQKWVAAGAEYVPHWSFVPPREVPLPAVKQADRPRNFIDNFVLAKLEAAGLKPSPEADAYSLCRRVHYDLIGLPPTVEEADAFAKDYAAKPQAAYEALVDKLLASPQYGERWARRWLDMARYADTNGYEKDRKRSIWPYRDWVIAALNADMPFDRFTIEQLAGDMLPNATAEQRIATGFHRNTMLNEEGGIDPLEFRFHAMTDRTAVTGTVWLGLTVGCAQCHTHKYDPLPHRDYYRMFALLNNADEPEMDVPRPDIAAKRADIAAKAAAAEADLANRFPAEPAAGADDKRDEPARRRDHLNKKFDAWLAKESAAAVKWQVLRPVEAKANVPKLTVLDDGSVLASGDQGKRDVYDLKLRFDKPGITAIRLEVLPDAHLPRGGPGRVYYEGPFGDFFLSEFTLVAGGKKLPFAAATQSFGKNPAKLAIDGDPQTGWSIDGGQGKAHRAVFTLKAPTAESGEFELTLLFERYYAAGLGRFRISVTDNPKAAAGANPAEIEELLTLPGSERSPAQRERLLRHFVSVAPELAKERAEIDKLRKSAPAFPTTLVMAERPADNPRPTFVHNRGEFLQPTQPVEPGVFSFLPQLPKDAPANRLTFARWLVSADNPLTARVTVNREWSAFFGRGLVRTVGDFGFTGEPPTHRELLDRLAIEFVRQGWSLKKLHKLIVTSATYRQASRVAPELLAKDAENRLLARGPRVRMEAEMIRDGALRAAGLLSYKIGGPSVFPPQPAGVTTEGAYGKLDWKPSAGEDRVRRSLYTFAKRTAPFALYATFDAPSGEFCTPRREVSDTPLQALTLLNDPVFLEAGQALGRLAAAAPGTPEQKAAGLFRRILTRPPTAEETASLVKFFEAQKTRCEAKELNAAALAGAGEGDVNARAAWTALARALMNLDEAVTKE